MADRSSRSLSGDGHLQDPKILMSTSLGTTRSVRSGTVRPGIIRRATLARPTFRHAFACIARGCTVSISLDVLDNFRMHGVVSLTRHRLAQSTAVLLGASHGSIRTLGSGLMSW